MLCFPFFFVFFFHFMSLVCLQVALAVVTCCYLSGGFCSGRFRCAKVFASVLLSAVNSFGHGGSSVDLQMGCFVCPAHRFRLAPPARREELNNGSSKVVKTHWCGDCNPTSNETMKKHHMSNISWSPVRQSLDALFSWDSNNMNDNL